MNNQDLAQNNDLVESKVARTQPIVDESDVQEQGLGLNDTEYIAAQAGVNVPDGVPLNIKETIEKRDAER